MDLQQLLERLKVERANLDEIISSLKQLENTLAGARPFLKTRRGRKSMDDAARKEVSERMKRYWARRRQAKNETSQ
jgi:hypothetical protein